MTKQALASKNPDIVASAKALRRAARRALDIGLNTGTPVYAIEDGQIVDLTQQGPRSMRAAAPLAVREQATAYRAGKPRRKK
jgi:hypothetical protein